MLSLQRETTQNQPDGVFWFQKYYKMNSKGQYVL